MLVWKMDCIPLEILCRNLAFGTYLKRHKNCETLKPLNGLIEFSLKSDAEKDPILTEEQILQRQISSPEELALMKGLAQRANRCLQDFLKGVGIILVDFKMEFGRQEAKRSRPLGKDGALWIIDDLSPDTARFMSASNPKKILTHAETAGAFGMIIHV